MIEFIFGITFFIVVGIIWKGVSCLKNHKDTSED
jgi:hypothetical protein